MWQNPARYSAMLKRCLTHALSLLSFLLLFLLLFSFLLLTLRTFFVIYLAPNRTLMRQSNAVL